MEGVEEVVVVVDGEVHGPGPGFDDLLQVFEHVDVGEVCQLGQLLALEEGDHELAEGVLAPGLVRVDDHSVVGLDVVTQLQVVGEEDVAEDGLEKKKEN